jgi:hypothetical protein
MTIYVPKINILKINIFPMTNHPGACVAVSLNSNSCLLGFVPLVLPVAQ